MFGGVLAYVIGNHVFVDLVIVLGQFWGSINIAQKRWLLAPVALLVTGQCQWITLWWWKIYRQKSWPTDDSWRFFLLGAQITLFVVLLVKVFIVDTVTEHKRQKKEAGFKMQRDLFSMLVFCYFSMWSPFTLQYIMQDLLLWADKEPFKLILVMMIWSGIMLFMYLLVRIVAGRVFRYEHMPVAMFPVHLISDILSELIMGEFPPRTGSPQCILTFLLWL